MLYEVMQLPDAGCVNIADEIHVHAHQWGVSITSRDLVGGVYASAALQLTVLAGLQPPKYPPLDPPLLYTMQVNDNYYIVTCCALVAKTPW